MDEGCGEWLEGDQHSYPSPTLQEGQLWVKRASHGDLKTEIKMHRFEFIKREWRSPGWRW